MLLFNRRAPTRSTSFRIGVWTLHFLGLALAAFWLTWWMLTPLDFGFRVGYHLLDIDSHIEEFGPQNVYRHGYENTTESERFAHFADIVKAINAGGKGLATITYNNGESPAPTLLTMPEVVHLQDVSALVSMFHVAGPIALLIWLVSALFARKSGWQTPSARQLIAGTALLLVFLGTILLIAGPTTIFYWLHTHVFPANHQWFFYYQESLMTTLMKAPDLFGFIAGLWASFAFAVIAITVALERHWMQRGLMRK